MKSVKCLLVVVVAVSLPSFVMARVNNFTTPPRREQVKPCPAYPKETKSQHQSRVAAERAVVMVPGGKAAYNAGQKNRRIFGK